VKEPWRQILEPLKGHQLAGCLRQGRLDRYEDVCGKRPPFYLSGHLVMLVGMLAERMDEDDELRRLPTLARAPDTWRALHMMVRQPGAPAAPVLDAPNAGSLDGGVS
jgi:hypothetical protein